MFYGGVKQDEIVAGSLRNGIDSMSGAQSRY